VIPAQYIYPAVFMNGRAIVTMPNESQRVINSLGDLLFIVPPGFYLTPNYSATGFVMYVSNGGDMPPKFLTNDFYEITLPKGADSTYMFEQVNDKWCIALID